MLALFSRRGFTIIEVLAAATVFIVVATAAITALTSITVSKNLTIDRSDLIRDLYTSIETVVETIKRGGTLDYEWYFERHAMSYSRTWSTLFSGTILPEMGFGNYGASGAIGSANYGSGFYHCRSGSGAFLTGSGCFAATDGTGSGEFLNTFGRSLIGSPQRFGQYQLQFKDYNANRNDDIDECASIGFPGVPMGDQDCSGSPLNDSDDIEIGLGPNVLSGTGPYLTELMMIRESPEWVRRSLLRWRLERDSKVSSSLPCDTSLLFATWACVGRLESLSLLWFDYGSQHNGSGTTSYDGLVDTWVCDVDYNCQWPAITIGSQTYRMPSGTAGEWVPILPSQIDVRSVTFTPANIPNSASRYGWAHPSEMIGAPYIRLSAVLWFSPSRRSRIGSWDPTVTIQTTINLSE